MHVLRVTILSITGEVIGVGTVDAYTPAAVFGFELLLKQGFTIQLDAFDPNAEPISDELHEGFLDAVNAATSFAISAQHNS